MRPCTRPHWLGLAPGTARLDQTEDRKCDHAPRLPLRRAVFLTSPLYGARANGFEGPTWGTCEFLRRLGAMPGSRRTVRTGRQTSTLITCLVQPWCCNREWKLRGAGERQWSRVPIVTIKRRRKSSTEILHALTSEAIYGLCRSSGSQPR